MNLFKSVQSTVWLLLLLLTILFGFIGTTNARANIQRGTAKYSSPTVDEATAFNSAESIQVPKTSKERVIKAETESYIPKRANFKSRNENKESSSDDKEINRIRGFRKNENNNKVAETTIRTTGRTYRKRPGTSTTTELPPIIVTSISAQKSVENRQNRKSNFNSRNAITTTRAPFTTTIRSRKVFTTRPTTESTTESVTTRAPKRIPLTRGNFRAGSSSLPAGLKKESNDDLEDENYPEPFKALLKAKLKDTKDKSNENNPKGYSKANKPIQLPRLEITTKIPSKPATKYPTRTRSLPKYTTTTTLPSSATSTSTLSSESSLETVKKNNLRRPRPTDESKSQHRFGVQAPPFVRPTRITTSSAGDVAAKIDDLQEISTEKLKVLSQSKPWSAIGTSSVVKYNPRIHKNHNYQPTVPVVTTQSANLWEWSITHPHPVGKNIIGSGGGFLNDSVGIRHTERPPIPAPVQPQQWSFKGKRGKFQFY